MACASALLLGPLHEMATAFDAVNQFVIAGVQTPDNLHLHEALLGVSLRELPESVVQLGVQAALLLWNTLLFAAVLFCTRRRIRERAAAPERGGMRQGKAGGAGTVEIECEQMAPTAVGAVADAEMAYAAGGSAAPYFDAAAAGAKSESLHRSGLGTPAFPLLSLASRPSGLSLHQSPSSRPHHPANTAGRPFPDQPQAVAGLAE
eukprot:gene20760-23757_t